MRNYQLAIVCACVSSLLLSACEGESRPFEEAVEVRDLMLDSLVLVPPENSLPEIFINIGQTFQLDVQGRNTDGQTVELSGLDRSWLTSDNAFATVDANGLVTGRSNGRVNVVMDIDDIRSAVFTLEVSDADLSDIVSIEGPRTVERCLPSEDYRATGLYSDDTTRRLPATDWTVTALGTAAATDDARVLNNADATATLTGLNSGMVQLNASLDTFSLNVPIEVSTSLTSIDIAPNTPGVDVGRTLDFTAQATFNGPAPATDSPATTGTAPDTTTRRRDITNAVDWEITSGTDVASVSNSDSTRGRLTGLASGSANLRASCGDLFADVSVAVRTPGGSNTDNQLSFDQDGPIVLLLSNTQGIDLSVSTGSVFNEANRLASGITCSVSSNSTTTQPVAFATIDNSQCRIQPRAIGTATLVATRAGGGSVSIEIDVR